MLDRNSAKPLHRQVEELIREKIETEEWESGKAIPSENELSKNLGVSRMTSRNVITKLVQEGLLYRIPGKGTFVCEQKIAAQSLSYEGIRQQLERLGYEVMTKLLDVSQEAAGRQISNKLLLDDGEKIYVIRRLRFVKGQPFSIHTSYIPVAFAPGLEKLDLAGEQLCSLLSKKYDLNRERTFEELTSVAAGEEEAELLDVPAGYPLLLLQDTIVDRNGKPFEFAEVVFRGDRIKLQLEFGANG